MPCKAHLTRLHTDHSKCVEKSELVVLLCAVSLAAAGQPPVARACGASSSSSTAAGVEARRCRLLCRLRRRRTR